MQFILIHYKGIRQFLFQSDYRFTPDDVVLFIYTCPWWITDINGKYKLDFLPTTTNPSKALDYIKGDSPYNYFDLSNISSKPLRTKDKAVRLWR